MDVVVVRGGGWFGRKLLVMGEWRASIPNSDVREILVRLMEARSRSIPLLSDGEVGWSIDVNDGTKLNSW